MQATWRAAVLLGMWLACGLARGADDSREAARVQLIVAPHGDAPEFRIVELDGESRALPLGAGKALFPSWRDKGRQLVFESPVSGHSQIYAMDAAGGEWQNLSNNNANDHQPACSPDGKQVLFTSDRGGDFDIYVMDADGRNPLNLTHDPGFDSDAAWSPDGKRIAFASDRSGQGFHLMVMNADGSDPHNVLDRNLGGMLYPCWSPDGQQIAFGQYVQPDTLRLYVANADGQGLQELTDGPGMSCYPCWSPDGRYLAYVHFARHPNQTPEGGRLMLVDIEEGVTSEFGAGAPRVTASRMAWLPAEDAEDADADSSDEDEGVNVLCVDDAGKPVAGAEVHVFQCISGKATRYKHFGPFTSDAEGRAACPRAVVYFDAPGRFDRWAYARVPGRLVGVARSANWKNHSPVNPEFHVQLRPSTSVEGRVTVPDGFSPPQVTVRVQTLHVITGPGNFDYQGFPRSLPFAGLDTALPEIFDKRPDAEGRFRFDDVPVRGRLYLTTVGAGLGEAQWWNENKPFDTLVRLDVKKEGVLTGRVALPNGKPAAGMNAAARISFDPDRRFSNLTTFRTVTDADGKFTLHGLPDARYVLSVEDPAGQWLFRPRERLLVTPGDTLKVDVAMESGVAVSGRVVDPDGHPVEGAGLAAVSDTQGGPSLGYDSTDREGRYRLHLPAGRARLYFNGLPDGFVYPKPDIVKRLEITAGQEPVEGLDFTIPRTEQERDAVHAASLRPTPAVAKPKKPNPALAKQIDAIAQQRAQRGREFDQELRAAQQDDKKVRDANVRFQADRRELAEDLKFLISEHAAEAEAFDGVLVLVGEMQYFLDESLTAIVLDHHLADPDMGRLCFALRHRGGEAWAETILKAAADAHPKREVRGQAVFSLGDYYRDEAFPWGQETPEPKKSELLAAARSRYQQTIDEFPEAPTPDGKTTLGDKARHELTRLKNLPDLKVGRPAPPIEAEALDGKPMSLAEHRGKVVLLVFWGSWCGPCMEQVPHERELVERHRGKPFVLLGVNCGDARDAAKATMEKQQMTWRCWWDGEETRGPIETDYDVPHWPRVFVIDAEGVIREIDPEPDELDRTIEKLLQAAAKQ